MLSCTKFCKVLLNRENETYAALFLTPAQRRFCASEMRRLAAALRRLLAWLMDTTLPRFFASTGAAVLQMQQSPNRLFKPPTLSRKFRYHFTDVRLRPPS
jgi:hypothetical protein